MDGITSISPVVVHQFQKITAELGEAFSFDALTGYVERWRQKPLWIEEDQMPADMSGYSIALRDCDLICVRPGLTYTHGVAVRLHEACHLIRGDLPLLSAGEKTPTYRQFIRLRDKLALVVSRQLVDSQRFLHMYDSPVERHTELLARLCLQSIVRHNTIAPSIAVQVFGHELME